MLNNKGQCIAIFLHFEAMVSTKFNIWIKQLQSDGGIELNSWESYLFQNGYVRKISCLHISSYNGVIERKNRHIVKVRLEMIMRLGVPMKFWDYYFKSSLHLLNRLPLKP